MKLPRLLALGLPFVLVPAAQAAAPSASARLVACDSSLVQSSRTMAVEGRMRTVAGAGRLQMRFALQVLTPERPRWTRVAAPGFGVWNTADPAPRRYVFAKRVEALTAPARYRMTVRFRWLDRTGRRIAVVRRTSPTCAQADLRPDLVPERVSVAPGADSGSRRYVVPVRNAGRSAAGAFAVGLTVNGVALTPIAVVTGLQVGGRSQLAFAGPACLPGTRLEVRVDPDGAVDERDEAGNALTRACPEGQAGASY